MAGPEVTLIRFDGDNRWSVQAAWTMAMRIRFVHATVASLTRDRSRGRVGVSSRRHDQNEVVSCLIPCCLHG